MSIIKINKTTANGWGKNAGMSLSNQTLWHGFSFLITPLPDSNYCQRLQQLYRKFRINLYERFFKKLVNISQLENFRKPYTCSMYR